MVNIKPFKGLRYNNSKVNLEEVVTEPYDRIPPKLKQEYHKKSPYNFVKVILGKDKEKGSSLLDKYERADLYLKKWLQEKILIQDEVDSLYIYEQEFKINGEIKKRKGIITLVKIEDYSSKKILPHEKTFAGPKKDRLNLLKATKAHTELIFGLYEDKEKKIKNIFNNSLKENEQIISFKDEDGFLHKVSAIKNHQIIKQIQEAIKDKSFIIADGHHRYDTSLNFKNEMAKNIKEPYKYTLMAIFDIEDPGLVILPTFRLVKGIEKIDNDTLIKLFSQNFEVSIIEWQDTKDTKIIYELQKNKINDNSNTFAACVPILNKIYLLKLKKGTNIDNEIKKGSSSYKKLDVVILHNLLINKLFPQDIEQNILESNIDYVRNLDRGINLLSKKEFQILFLLPGTSLEQINEVVKSGELMPHKSTDFFPKLKSGLLIYSLK